MSSPQGGRRHLGRGHLGGLEATGARVEADDHQHILGCHDGGHLDDTH